MKKIVILVDQLHSHGGIEKLVALKANYWVDVFGYEVVILSTEQDNKPIIYKLSNRVRVKDLQLGYIRSKSYFSVRNIIKFSKNIALVQNFIRHEKPDFVLVASHIPITYIVPFLIGKHRTIKEFHFTKFYKTKTGLKNKVLTYIEGKYDFLVVLSEEERKFYFSNNTVVIANPVVNIKFENDYSNKTNKAFAIGRFAPVKQLDKMIEIWSRFTAINKHWKLHVFGETGNDYFKMVQKLVIDKNLESFVIFEGQSSSIHSELAKAKILLLTSEQECFPMVILEANSVGVPVLSFDSPTGPRNIIHHNEDGILVPYDDYDTFVKELTNFDNDLKFQEKLSQNAKANSQHYFIDAIMSKWNKLIFKNE